MSIAKQASKKQQKEMKSLISSSTVSVNQYSEVESHLSEASVT
jgi:hypothetical protein